MPQEVKIICLEDRDCWVAEHRDGGLPSQAWDYAWGLSASGVRPFLAVVHSQGARMLLPFFERPWGGSTDVATIVGASGASIVPNSAAPLALWREYATGRGWVAGYIQLAPAVALDQSAVDGELVTNNVACLLDIGSSDPLQFASRTIRRKIRSAVQRGAVLLDDRLLLAENLKALYPLTMRRRGAPPHFDFSPETIGRWVSDPTALVLGARLDDGVMAVYLFLTAGRSAEALITGSSEAGRDLVPWLIWCGIPRLRERGVTMLNLGGGLRPGDGLARFKRWFNGVVTPRQAVHQIYDRARYDELCHRAGVSSTGHWFPAYRSACLAPTGRSDAPAAPV